MKNSIVRRVNIGGIECEIRPELECAAAGVMRLAVTKAEHQQALAGGGTEIAGTKDGFFCRVCGVELVLAPSGQRIHALGGDFTCLKCVVAAYTQPQA